MSSTSIPYQLRPNKAADRELFLSLLSRLSGVLEIENYTYISLGGPFLEDFRLIHSRFGVSKMVCIETDPETHKRQLFNRPVNTITCEHQRLEDYLDEYDHELPVIIWFDYTTPKSLDEQIGRFCRTIDEVVLGSVLRVTLNANPTSLGDPIAGELKISTGKAIQSWRLEKFKQKMGEICPTDILPNEMSHKEFGKVVLKTLQNAIESKRLSLYGKDVVYGFSSHYSDGQPMVTLTLVVVESGDSIVAPIVKNWPFYCDVRHPHVIDLPVLSPLERMTIELDGKGSQMEYKLPKSQLGQDGLKVFKKFYRLYPQFAKVDL